MGTEEDAVRELYGWKSRETEEEDNANRGTESEFVEMFKKSTDGERIRILELLGKSDKDIIFERTWNQKRTFAACLEAGWTFERLCPLAGQQNINYLLRILPKFEDLSPSVASSFENESDYFNKAIQGMICPRILDCFDYCSSTVTDRFSEETMDKMFDAISDEKLTDYLDDQKISKLHKEYLERKGK